MTALVLGGGGVTGIAWTTGLLLGLAESGGDLTGSELVVGTSAGAAVGAQVTTGRSLEELFEAQCAPAPTEIAAELDLELLMEIFASADSLARMGELACAAPTVPEPVRRAVIEARLGTDEWPAGGRLRITAVDVGTGELVVFDGTDGVGLIDAVAASCAVPGVWPPVTIGERRYMDGGVRSVSNADLASGDDDVVVVLPLGGELDREVEAREVTVLTVDAEALAAMGPNPLDPAYRRAAAEAGRRQGRALRSG